MSFIPGQSGNPNGRPAGSKNKKTSVAFDEFLSIYVDNIPRLKEELAKLQGKEFVSEMNKMADWVFPRQQRVIATNFNFDEPEVKQVFKIGEQIFEL